jgi:hypothetical protein
MRIYAAALGLLLVVVVTLVSIFVVAPALTDDDDDENTLSYAALPGATISHAITNGEGIALFDNENGGQVEVRVHAAGGTAMDGASVHYIDGDGFELFVAEDPSGRALPFWEFFTQATSVDLTAAPAALTAVEQGSDQFDAMAPWSDAVKASADVLHCATGTDLANESDTSVVLTSIRLSPQSMFEGVGAVSTTNRFVLDTIHGPPESILFDVFDFHLQGIDAAFRHYEAISLEDCLPEPTVAATPAPSATPVPGQPTNTPTPEGPTDTPVPGEPTDTPALGAPTNTPAPFATDTPVPAGPTNTPRPQPTVAPPVAPDFITITGVQPPLGTRITQDTVVTVTVQYRVSSVTGVSISGLADMGSSLLSLGVVSPTSTQGTVTLTATQYGDLAVRFCSVSVTMERVTGGGRLLASDTGRAC